MFFPLLLRLLVTHLPTSHLQQLGLLVFHFCEQPASAFLPARCSIGISLQAWLGTISAPPLTIGIVAWSSPLKL